MNIEDKIKQTKILVDRIKHLFDLCGDDTNKIQILAEYSKLEYMDIKDYINNNNKMKLPDIGLLIIAIKKYFSDDIGNKKIADYITIENMSEGLSSNEYTLNLRVENKDHLISKLNKKIPKKIIDNVFENKPYAYDLLSEWEEREVGNKFIKDLYIPITIKGTEKKIDDELDEWIKKSESPFFILLGDIGIGKTTSLEFFKYRQAKRHIEDAKNEPVPIFFDLSRFKKANDMDMLIESTLFNHFKDKVEDIRHLYDLVSKGRIVFILDGFDEMAVRLSKDVLSENLDQIAKLYHNKGKLILSSRKQIFTSNEHIFELIKKTKLGQCIDNNNYENKELNPFKKEDIDDYINKYYDDDHDHYKQKLKKLPDFEQICSVPMMLDMMVRIIPDIEKKIENMTKAGIFDLYYNKWFERNNKKNKRLNDPQKLKIFCQELAGVMFLLDKPEISYNRLKQEIKNYYNPEDPSEYENITMAITNDSFLTRNGNEWSFIHEAFYYYFLALALINSKNRIKLLENKILHSEVLDFLKQMEIDTIYLLDKANEIKIKGKNQTHSDDILYKNIESILYNKGYKVELINNLPPVLLEKIKSTKGMLDITNEIYSLIKIDKFTKLKDILDIFIKNKTKLSEIYGITEQKITDIFIKLAELQNSEKHRKINHLININKYYENVKQLINVNDIEHFNNIINNFNSILTIDNSNSEIQFKDELFYHYYLAYFFYKKIQKKEHENIGLAPVESETLKWFSEIVPETELISNSNDASINKDKITGAVLFRPDEIKNLGSIGSIIKEWLENSKDENWRKVAGDYIGSLCLSILNFIKYEHKNLTLEKGYFPCSYLKEANLADLNISGINLSYSYLGKAELQKATINNANLKEVNFENAFLTEADFTGSDLSNANFSGAYLNSANFTDCNLKNVDFSKASSAINIIK